VPREGVPVAAVSLPVKPSAGLDSSRVSAASSRHAGRSSVMTTSFQADPAAAFEAVMV
jgi:hypothetical protein